MIPCFYRIPHYAFLATAYLWQLYLPIGQVNRVQAFKSFKEAEAFHRLSDLEFQIGNAVTECWSPLGDCE